MIKFRAWDKEHKRMLNMDMLALGFSHKGVLKCIYSFGPDYSNDPDIIGDDEPDLDSVILDQFTGLKDKYGVEIYEGDIVHGYDQEPDRDDGYIGSSVTDVVNFKYGVFWIGDNWNKVMVMTPPIVEVIGNVHTNHELLEDKL